MNLKTKVMAAEVSNLTDARYFAAWGVEFMTYEMDPSSDTFIGQEAIKEIIDWVEGPQYLGYLSGMSLPSDLASMYEELQLHGLAVSPFLVNETLHELSPRVYREVLTENIATDTEEELLIVKLAVDHDLAALTPSLKALCMTNEVYIDGVRTVADLDTVLTEINPSGIVVRGGEEEKVGFKSYDELDEIFEYLEVMD